MDSPITGKPMQLLKETRPLEYKGKLFPVVYNYYKCADSGEEFTDNELDEINIEQVYMQHAAHEYAAESLVEAANYPFLNQGFIEGVKWANSRNSIKNK